MTKDAANHPDYIRYRRNREDYTQRLGRGKRYQDFLTKELPKLGIIPQFYTSHEYQKANGEGRGLIEAKLDQKFRTTGNIFIELEERETEDDSWYPSGWTHQRNMVFFLIGDYEEIYLFDRKTLLALSTDCKKVTTKTSRGYLLPVHIADRHAHLHYRFNDKAVVT